MRKFPYNTIAAFFILCCLGFIIYSNTFHSSFHFDDSSSIVKNANIKDLADIKAIWNFWPTRFITFFSFGLNYHFNRLNVFGYHFVNLLIHLCSSILVFWLIRLTLSAPAVKKDRSFRRADLIALAGALVFLVHPAQTESVTYIYQRSASLAGFFYIFSLCLYIKARLLRPEGEGPGAHRQVILYVFSLVMAVISMLTKENAMTLPLMILLYEFYFLSEDRRVKWKYSAPFFIISLIAPALLFLTRPSTFLDIQTFMGESVTARHYLLTQFRVVVTYIRILFVPFNQNLDYDYAISKSLFELPVLASLFVLIFILAAAVRAFAKYRLVSFGIFWFFVTLLPESGIIPLRDVIFEHRLYLPMAGYCFFMSGIVYYARYRKIFRPMVMALIIAIVSYSMMSYIRNFAWRNEVSLWEDVTLKSPNKARGYINLGNAYKERGDFNRAAYNYERALNIKPDYDAYNNLGAVYLRVDKKGQAEEMIKKAIEIEPGLTGAYNNLAIAYNRSGRKGDAIAVLMKAIEVDPDYADTYYNMGFIYSGMGRDKEAVDFYKKAISLNPFDPYAHYALAEAYYRLKEYALSIEHCDKVIELGYQVDPAFLNLIKPYRARAKRGNM
ncbi:MAG: tetratricopeptide repeat protein [Candidatus Omnitrophota bacterium]|nr:tetratricopeptide repeat protein [Candidatus Omnitrophota bacterium]